LGRKVNLAEKLEKEQKPYARSGPSKKGRRRPTARKGLRMEKRGNTQSKQEASDSAKEEAQ